MSDGIGVSEGGVKPQVAMQGEPLRLASASSGPPWLLLIVGALLALGVYRGPEIIRAWNEHSGVVVPDDTKPAKSLFADKHCAEYFAAAAEHVAKIVEADGAAKTPRLTKTSDMEIVAGGFVKSLVLGDLHDVDQDKLMNFVNDGLVGAGVKNAVAMTPELRAKFVDAWKSMGQSALKQVK